MRAFASAAAAIFAVGCAVSTPNLPDRGVTDPGSTDPGSTDPGSTDAGTTDAGTTDAGTTDAGATDGGTTDAGGTDDETEVLPEWESGSDAIFRDDVVHELSLTLSDPSWAALIRDGRSWVPADLTSGGRTWHVGMRLKGNTTYDVLTSKPAIKIDVNHYVADQDFYGLPSFYLQNQRWDPSAMHEFLAYGFFNEVSVPAARAAYTHLKVNDLNYGIYVLLEKQSGAFMRRWFDDDSGSIYESGSFNWPCDVNDGPSTNPCDCFEVDTVGTADERDDLQELCRAATNRAGAWYDNMKTVMDMDLFLHGTAAEMVVSHYDNYGWNINNFRIAHLPDTGRWVFTPWSTDLAFGWYPWTSHPHCGSYGVTPDEYQGGILVQHCWADADCSADLKTALADQADAFEAWGVRDRIDAADHLIRPIVEADGRRLYTVSDYTAESECLRDFADTRPDAIRAWLIAHP